jgi:aminoglycoside 3-N-acetyltransferase
VKTTSAADWTRALEAAGARRGDTLMVHSHLPAFGLIEGGPQALIVATAAFLGPDGTLVMPAFTLSFGRTRVFDRENTPSEVGALTELFRRTPDVRRSLHPFHSVCALGRRADEITDAWAASSFGRGGPYERLSALDALFVCAGVTAERLTFVHYAEEKIGVPYRAKKEFPGKVFAGGKEDSRVYALYARDLRFKMDLPALGRKLADEGAGRESALPYGPLFGYRAAETYDAFARMLARDPGALLTAGSPIKELLGGSLVCTP